MAFVSSFTPATLRAKTTSPAHAAVTSMRYGIDLARYEDMSKGGPSDPFATPPADDGPNKPTVDVPPPAGSGGYASRMGQYAAMASAGPAAAYPGMQKRVASAPSSGWTNFAAGFAPPTVTKMFRKSGENTFADAMQAMKELAANQRAVKAPGGDPRAIAGSAAADRYMAESCVTPQYKAMANPRGVYEVGCTEGATKGQAEESRELSNLAAFRQRQRSTSQKYGDFTESRRVAINMAHGCSYEERLVSGNPQVAAAMVRGYSEARSLCVRYNNVASPAEEYMARSVDMQYKAKAVPTGVYTGTCADGNTSGLAEFKRVQALAARFRAGQMSAGAKAQAKYDARLFARSMFRTCGCACFETVLVRIPDTCLTVL